MHNEELHKFLEGKLGAEQIRFEQNENSAEKDFISSYQQIIKENNAETPDFNAFEKIEQKKIKPNLVIKKLLPYAASVLLIVGSVFVYQNYHSQKTNINLSEVEIQEIQENTALALMHFSKELNACFAKFDDAKAMQTPINKLNQLSELKIQLDNPLNNLKYK